MGPYDRSCRRNWELEEDDNDTKGYNTTLHPRAKVNFHKFEGGDLYGWTLKAETQFRVSKSPFNPPNKHLSIPSYPTRIASTLAPSQLQNNYNPLETPFSPYNNQTRNQTQPNIPLTTTQSWEYEKQVEHEKGLCFLCEEKFRPGHHCKSLGFLQMEINEESEAHDENESVEAEIEEETSELVEISFPATSRKTNGTAKKMQESLKLERTEDKITLNPTNNEILSMKSCYLALTKNEEPPLRPIPVHCREIWVKSIPQKTSILFWGLTKESLGHFFMHRTLARYIWYHFLSFLNLYWILLESFNDFLAMWKFHKWKEKGKRRLWILPMPITWNIWNEMNNRKVDRSGGTSSLELPVKRAD